MNIDVFQKAIHRLEVGGGLRYLRIALIIFAVLLTMFFYDFWGFKNMGTQEAMDAAQLGRNIAEGKGYTTLFIRPFSVHLIETQNKKLNRIPQQGSLADPAQILGMHPDISNPPLYPVVLAGLMSVLPFEYAISSKLSSFWSFRGYPGRYQPDFLIALFNQVLLMITVLLVVLLAYRLFGKAVAWLSGVVLLGTELLWRFSSSGLSTMLLLLIVTGLVWCMIWLEQELREPRWGPKAIYLFAVAAGLLVGAGALTRYSVGFLILPVLFFIAVYAGRQRWSLGVLALVTFLLVLAPWVVRNYSVCGAPFGTATYKLLESSGQFPEHNLERSLHPDLSQAYLVNTARTKLVAGVKQVLTHDLPGMSGSWLSAFFLAGLLVAYPNDSVRRLRWFLVGCLVVLALLQGTGRTQLSEDVLQLNSENLLVLLVPFLTVYGVNLFLLLLDQVEWPMRELRYAAMVGFALLAALPLILTLFFSPAFPLSYPPYMPATIQRAALWTEKDELIMSDMPWAVAWYGNTQSIWLTLDPQEDFFAINDYLKSVQELYLTPVTMDSKFMSHWRWPLRSPKTQNLQSPQVNNWGGFILDCKLRDDAEQNGPPKSFPLQFWDKRFYPESFLLTARRSPVRASVTSASENSGESAAHSP